nr:uncharacterized protein LOC108948839 [Nicotiana tomentosiformis]
MGSSIGSAGGATREALETKRSTSYSSSDDNDEENNSTFEVLLKDSYIKQDYLHIPKRLYEHIPEEHTTAVLQYGGKEWFVGMNIGERRWIKDGWKKFCDEE